MYKIYHRPGLLAIILSVIVLLLVTSCSAIAQTPGTSQVVAIESFLADIARNVAGTKLSVDSLIPLGADPHAYSPSTQDAEKIVNANIVIINGANLESFIAPILQNSISNQLVVTASDGLTVQKDPTGMNPEGDPHFWLDPNNVIIYTENIEKGFSKAFPSDQDYFQANSQKYIAELQDLDTWIKLQVQSIPAHRRLLVTNHETFGYFAGRYGFTVVGAIIPGFSSEAATSAQEVADLVRQIHLTNAPAIFLETGSNPQLAQQVAAETGVKVIYGLYTHSLSNIGGPAPTYIDMMKYDVTVIVEALK